MPLLAGFAGNGGRPGGLKFWGRWPLIALWLEAENLLQFKHHSTPLIFLLTLALGLSLSLILHV